MSKLTITDAKGQVTQVRNSIRAFGALHPLTAMSAALIAGLVIGLLFG